MKINSSFIKQTMPFLLLIITILLQLIFRHHPSITESIYSTNIYPIIATVLSNLSYLIPFSLSDIFYITLIGLFLFGVIRSIINRKTFFRLILSVLQGAALIYCLFYVLWGFNYYREPAHTKLSLTKSAANDSTFIQMFDKVIEQTNQYYTDTNGFKKEKNDSLIEVSIKNNSAYLGLKHSMGKRRLKHITLSNFFAKATILGYYGPFFSETHINRHLTLWDIPVVSAHEKSHQLGVTSEAEASFYGWFITTKSNDRFTQYAGWLYALNYFLYQSHGLKNRRKYFQKIKPEVIDDLKQQSKHWQKWRDEKIDKAAAKVNDAYLKSNNVEKGIDDYNGVVQLIIDYLQQETTK